MFKCSTDTEYSFHVMYCLLVPAQRDIIQNKTPIKHHDVPSSLLTSPFRGAVKMVCVDLTSISVVISQSCLHDLYSRL